MVSPALSWARSDKRNDAVAWLEGADASTHRPDDASEFTAGREGQRWLDLVLVLDDQYVRKVDAGGLDVDGNFTCCRYHIG
jgi:hypothetical protein